MFGFFEIINFPSISSGFNILPKSINYFFPCWFDTLPIFFFRIQV